MAPDGVARHGLPASVGVLLSTVTDTGGGASGGRPDASPAGRGPEAEAEPPDAHRGAGTRVDPAEVDWAMLYRLAVRERAGTVLWRRHGGWMEAAAPGPWPERFRALASVSEFRQRRLQRRLEETAEAMAAAEIPVVLLKGAALSRTVYPDPSERPMYDLDLLVPGDRAGEARRVARETGWVRRPDRYPENRYGRHPHLPPLVDAEDGEMALELHTDLFIEGHPLALTAGGLASRAAELSLGGPDGPTVRVPEPVTHLLYVCLHFAWSHALSRGAWRAFRDVAALGAAGCDWDDFADAARAARGGSCCHWALRLAASLGGVDVPERVVTGLRPELPDAVARRLERHFALDLFAGGCPSFRMRRWAWSVAVAPRSAGHGSARPWDHDEDFVPRAGRPEEEARPDGVARRIGQTARRLRYVWAVVGPRGTAAGGA